LGGIPRFSLQSASFLAGFLASITAAGYANLSGSNHINFSLQSAFPIVKLLFAQAVPSTTADDFSLQSRPQAMQHYKAITTLTFFTKLFS
jgi:hypothetical protein